MRILMLEDDATLAQLVDAHLRKHFKVDIVNSLSEADDFISHYNYDVILLDRNINGEDIGLNLIHKIKNKDRTTGIIIISAYDSISDKIKGLNLGADDYLEKPFDNDELVARIHAQARKHQPLPKFHIKNLTFDIQTKTVLYNNKNLAFTKKESDLLFYLIQKKGQIVSKDELTNILYVNPQNISSNTIDVTIGHIRKKLPLALIKTIKTRGYIIE